MKTFCWVYYSIRDGETEYGEYEPVVVNGQYDDKSEEDRAKLEKLLLFKVVGEGEFGMEIDGCEENYESGYLEEEAGYRIGEIGRIDVIPEADFKILKKYLGCTEITADFEEKVAFT